MDLPAGGDVFDDDDGSTHEDNITVLPPPESPSAALPVATASVPMSR